MDILEVIVDHYIAHHRTRAEKELHFFAMQKTIERAVALAALAKSPAGKRLSHQRRIPVAALQESQRRLRGAIGDLESASSFDDLHHLVGETIRDIRGIGPLTIYDTALRIGARLGLEPDRVYLHAGTRVGAKRLGLATFEGTIRIDETLVRFRRLKPREVEDVLCIYKDRFVDRQKSSRNRPSPVSAAQFRAVESTPCPGDLPTDSGTHCS